LYNLLVVEQDYERNLTFHNDDHSDVLFQQYLDGYYDRICPLEGVVEYIDGEVHCSVPFL
jgi:hypothetical protein